MAQHNNYCVIMAGGVGSRFWPLSNNQVPKQFLDVLGVGKSCIRSTYERLLPVVPPENFLVVTSAQYKDMVLRHLPELTPEQVLTVNRSAGVSLDGYTLKLQYPGRRDTGSGSEGYDDVA